MELPAVRRGTGPPRHRSGPPPPGVVLRPALSRRSDRGPGHHRDHLRAECGPPDPGPGVGGRCIAQKGHPPADTARGRDDPGSPGQRSGRRGSALVVGSGG